MRSNILISTFALALAGAATSQGAFAQAAPAAKPSIAAGARVSDTAGGEVGTITRVEGDHVILKTDKHEVRLPVSSFAAGQNGFVLAMTRAQVNAEVEKTLAAASANLAPGATVTGSAGGTVGTIEAIDAQFVTVKLASGTAVRLPRNAVAAGPNGAVIGMTVAELEAAAKGAAPAAAEAETAPEEGAAE
ncbi:MAG TPA: hypothetical protein VGW34_14570 [Allosphingosinicella sp.]|nr:hypothetical protein [Allosphingosinicella sp.]